jgi:alginate O-acetyltransferase complex protein AlgI
MVFVSFQFVLLFLPFTIAGFFLLSSKYPEASIAFLALMSVVFFATSGGNPLLLIISVIANYTFGTFIAKAQDDKPILARYSLIAALVFNLAILAYYKYANWFVDNLSTITGQHLAAFDVILPVGISFFTFTQIAFLVDCYSGKVRETKFMHYLLFVSFFPHLIAGPILHHSEMMPQFADSNNKQLVLRNCVIGLLLFFIGAFKKLVLADSISVFVSPIFDAHGGSPTISEAWSAALAYTFQIYFDFSGYTDMALGISRLFNIQLPLNFNSPYKATSIIDFWRRWHMTLSRFLRDYLYVPLGGNRHGQIRRYSNLMITMLLGGLWHGAGWTFIIWGALHGIYLMINHALRTIDMASFSSTILFALTSRMVTFLAVLVAWVFFRASDLASAQRVLGGMVNFGGHTSASYTQDIQPGLLPLLATSPWIWIGASFAIAWLFPNSQEIIASADGFVDRYMEFAKRSKRETAPVFVCCLSFLLSLLVFTIALNVVRDVESPFIYFNF